MKPLIFLPLLASLGMAIWPIPVEYSHGETVLWISEDVPFYWTAGAGNVNVGSGSLIYQNANIPNVYVGSMSRSWLTRRSIVA